MSIEVSHSEIFDYMRRGYMTVSVYEKDGDVMHEMVPVEDEVVTVPESEIDDYMRNGYIPVRGYQKDGESVHDVVPRLDDVTVEGKVQ